MRKLLLNLIAVAIILPGMVTAEQMKVIPNLADKLSDLTAGDKFIIAGENVSWGSLVDLSSEDASDITPHGCAFRYGYMLKNIGSNKAGMHENSLVEKNVTLHYVKVPLVNAGQNRNVAGKVILKDGNHLIHLHLDATGDIVETNEENNKFRISVNVNGCSQPPRPNPPVPGRPLR